MARSIDDFTFLVLCVKHSPEKLTPNFEAVVREAGSSTSSAAYQRFWAMKKKYGLPMNKAGSGTRKASSVSATPTKGADIGAKKRGRPAKAARKTHAAESEEEEEEEEENEAKPEPEPEDESDEEVESPAKKTKVSSAEDPKAAKQKLA